MVSNSIPYGRFAAASGPPDLSGTCFYNGCRGVEWTTGGNGFKRFRGVERLDPASGFMVDSIFGIRRYW